MDCYCLWMAASLYCSAWFDDATFDRILVSIMAPVPSILNELKISYIEKFLRFMHYGLTKQRHARIEKFWLWVLDTEKILPEDQKWLLLKFPTFLTNVTNGLIPGFANETLLRLMGTDITDSKKVMTVNGSASQVAQFHYRPANFPRRLGALGVTDDKIVRKYVAKECVRGFQEFYISIIRESLKAKDFEVTAYWFQKIYVLIF